MDKVRSGNNHPVLQQPASGDGGGAYGGTLFNCIVYYNDAPGGANYFTGDRWGEQITTLLSYSCTTPLPTNGVGNIDADPQMLSAVRLSSTSPCIGAGSETYASGVDIDGEPWLDPPCIGADQVPSGNWTGNLVPQILGVPRAAPPASPLTLTASVDGPAAFTVWDFGDGTQVTNAPSVSHAWATPGIYPVTLTAYNDSHPSGVTTVFPVRIADQPTVVYVNLANPNPSAPFTNWATAATDIQSAVDAALSGDTVLVTNGVYATGERRVQGSQTPTRVLVEQSIRLESVNGPAWTIIEGVRYGEMRCVDLGGSAVLSGFTLTNGHASWRRPGWGGLFDGRGGGARGGILTNCVLTGNSARYGGGGAYGCTLYNCTITDNSADWGPAGTSGCTLYHCHLSGNRGESDGVFVNSTLVANNGGASGSFTNCTVVGNQGGISGTAYNSISYFNTGANYGEGSVLNYCCATPLPTNGVGNIDADPLFVNAAAGDFRLRPDSPCIDAGTNLTDLLTTDLIGLPRVMDGNNDGVARVDIGAYEFNPYRFEPTLQLSPEGFQFTIRGEQGTNVRIERSSDLVSWAEAATVLIPTSGQTLIDPAATAEPFLFYRAVSVP